MTAAAVGLGDPAHVDVAQRAQAHADSPVGLFLEHAGDLGLGRAAQDVDQALDLLHLDAVAVEHLLGHRRPDEPLLAHELGAAQRLAEQLEVREAVLLEQRAAQAGDRHVELREAPRHVEDRGRRRVVLEPTGVADERGVQADRGVAVQRQPELVDEPQHDPAARGGVGLDEVDRPVAVVRDVVIDDDELARGLGRGLEVAEAAERTAVERDHDVGLDRELVRLGDQVEPGQLAVVRRDDERRRERRGDVTRRSRAARGTARASSRARHRRGCMWHASETERASAIVAPARSSSA